MRRVAAIAGTREAGADPNEFDICAAGPVLKMDVDAPEEEHLSLMPMPRTVGYTVAGPGHERRRVRCLSNTLIDTGACVNVVDTISAASALQAQGGSARISPAQESDVTAFNGSAVSAVGTCVIEVNLRDETTGEWHVVETRFTVVEMPVRMLILGIPFLKQMKASIDMGDEPRVTMRLKERTIQLRVWDETGDAGDDATAAEQRQRASKVASVQGRIADMTHPLVFTAREYVIPPTLPGEVGVEIAGQIPEFLHGCDLQILPLPDSATNMYANQQGLRLATIGGACVWLVTVKGPEIRFFLRNNSKNTVTIPAHIAVAQYVVGAELAPQADMSAEEIAERLLVEAGSQTEKKEIRDAILKALFHDRAIRRSYFSLKRVGKGTGVPPGEFEETEEFRKSGKAPPSQQARPVNKEQRAVQDAYQDNLAGTGHMVPSSSALGAAVFMIKKPKQTPGAPTQYRMAFDYRDTNAILVKQHYSLKSTRACVENLANSKWFSKLDCISAFWQYPLTPGSRKYTAVQFENGKWEFTTLPMGMQAASAIFQRGMDVLLAGLQPEVACSYIDDILIFGGDTL